MESILLVIGEFFKSYPIFSTILFIMGALRVVLKPIFTALHEYVLYTPNEADNAVLDKVEQSAFFKGLFWVLDYFASVKLVK